jgi:hypothetical protein
MTGTADEILALEAEAGRLVDGGPDPRALAQRAIDQSMLQDWLANLVKARKAVGTVWSALYQFGQTDTVRRRPQGAGAGRFSSRASSTTHPLTEE